MLYRIVSSFFTCRIDPFLVRVLLHSTVSIHPSLNCVVPDLFLSLYMLFVLVVFFSVRPSQSIRPLIMSYRNYLSLFTCRSNLVSLLVLLLWIAERSCSCSSTSISFDRIYLFVSLLCCIGSFPLSLCVVPIFFLFFFVLLLLLMILLFLL